MRIDGNANTCKYPHNSINWGICPRSPPGATPGGLFCSRCLRRPCLLLGRLRPGRLRPPGGFFFGLQVARLYDLRRWRMASRAFLALHPLCQCPYCDEGRIRVRAATVVDHRRAHRGDQVLFWDRSNWTALAKECHDSYKQRLEKSGVVEGCDTNGIPLDPNHHWNKTEQTVCAARVAPESEASEPSLQRNSDI